MKIKRLFTLLLALTMVLALGACSKKQNAEDASDARTEAEATERPAINTEPINGDFDDAIANLQSAYAAPTLDSFAEMAGGSLLKEEIAAYYRIILDAAGSDEQTLLEEFGMDGNVAQIIVTAETPMTDEDLAGYQAQLQESAAVYQAWLTEHAAYTDADWEALVAEMEDITVAQIKDVYAQMVPIVTAVAEKLAAAQITEGRTLTCVVTPVEGEPTETTLPIFCIDGEWVTQAFFSPLQLI